MESLLNGVPHSQTDHILIYPLVLLLDVEGANLVDGIDQRWYLTVCSVTLKF